MSSECKTIPLSQVRANKVALRQVNRNHEQWPGFIETIKSDGILNPISVRPAQDRETGESFYEVIDGLHRYTAALDLHMADIPVNIITGKDDESVLLAQLIANANRFQTKPVQYTEHLHRILAQNPTWTQTELAKRIGQEPSWLSLRFNLLKLTPEVKVLVDNGTITISKAHAMTKLPQDEQNNYIEQAISQSPSDLAANINARVREIRAANKKGVTPQPQQFQPIPTQRKFNLVRDTYLAVTQGDDKLAKEVCADMGAQTPEEGFHAALSWMVNMDKKGIAEQKQRYEDMLRKREEEKEKKRQEREAAKLVSA